MNNYSNQTTKIPLWETVRLPDKFKTAIIALFTIIFFRASVSAQDVTPPGLVNPSIGCSSLDQASIPECLSTALNFDVSSLEAAVAALYTDASLPVTASWLSTAQGSVNSNCSWLFTYTYEIIDNSPNFNSTTCMVSRSGGDLIPPTFNAPPNITLFESSLCEFAVNEPDELVSGDATNVADNCGAAVSITWQTCGVRRGTSVNETICIPGCEGAITIDRLWLATDGCGNATEKVQTITIVDNLPPVFTQCPSNFTAADCNAVTWDATAVDNCGPVDLSYEFTGATTGSGSGNGSGFPFNSGVTHVTITAIDDCGNSSTCEFDVTASSCTLEIAITAGITRTIYTGTVSGAGPFGPQSINLCSNVTGGTPGYTYNWDPATGLDDPNIPNPIATPTENTVYTLTVMDYFGRTGSLSIPINVLSLSSALCGNGNNVKFNVCHRPPGNPGNAQNICISGSALNEHLDGVNAEHDNCHLGPCQQLCFSTSAGGCQAPCQFPAARGIDPVTGGPHEDFIVQVYPNPSAGSFNVRVLSKSNEPVLVRIIDNNGAVLSVNSLVSRSPFIRIGGNLSSGTYVAEVTQGINRRVVKLIKLK